MLVSGHREQHQRAVQAEVFNLARSLLLSQFVKFAGTSLIILSKINVSGKSKDPDRAMS